MRFCLVTAALVAFVPALSSACATYEFCHCTNADGSINNAATKASCNKGVNSYENVDGVMECAGQVVSAGIGGVQPIFINNCHFREACNRNGAPGDSNCHAKS